MGNFLYALLISGVGWVIGATAFGAYVFLRLTQHTRGEIRRRYQYMALGKASYAATSSILIWVLVQRGETTVSTRGWAYALLSLVGGYAFSGVAKSGVDELADYEIEASENGDATRQFVQESAHDRFTLLEGRMTNEEARNTDIEDAARASKERADAAEAREKHESP